MINFFETGNFLDTASLSAAINDLKINWGRLGEMNLFPIKGITTHTAIVEEKEGILTLLPSQPPGSPPLKNKMGKRTARDFRLPFFNMEDKIYATELQGIRAFGSENQTELFAMAVTDHLETIKRKFKITLEWLRAGALQGNILDADGSTVLYNLFTEFDVTQKEIDFALDTSTTDVPQLCRTASRWIEDYLYGDTKTGIHALCGADFFDSFVSHESVVQAYLYHSEAATRLGTDMRKGFSFQNIVFEEFRESATDEDGTTHNFIATDEAVFFPVGTQKTFQTLVGPGGFVDAVNKIGQELYVRSEPLPYGQGLGLYGESYMLPICNNPRVLVKATA